MLNSTYQIQPIGFDSSKFNLSNSTRLLSQLDCIKYRTQTYQIQHLKLNSITSTRQTQTYQIHISNSTQLLQLIKLKLIKFTSQIQHLKFNISNSNSTNSIH